MPTCAECKFALFEDYGYSNYTVEGTTFHCLKKAHPDGEFDRFYGENEQLKFGNQCTEFCNGEPVVIDCDREAKKHYRDSLSLTYTTDPDIKPLLDAWETGDL